MNEENLCNCQFDFKPGLVIKCDSLSPLTCAQCHKIIRIPMMLPPVQIALQNERLALISIQDLLGELKNRFPHMVFMGKRYLNDKNDWHTLDTSNGDLNICAGLALEVAMKNIYFKIISSQKIENI